ncbi:MAG: hypothetical protein ACI4LX_05130 [Treponema sp.]
MKNKDVTMKHEKPLIYLSAMLLLASCSLDPVEGEKNPMPPEQTAIKEESSLFVQDRQNGLFTFETCDERYLNENGWTIWSVPYVNEGESFEVLSVEMIKESGRTEAGFGIVFCAQETGGKPFMLTVLINAGGCYTVGKVCDGVFSHVNGGWKNSGYINRGFGIKNNAEVSYDTGKKNFLLKINGYEITEFTVPEEIAFKDSKSGFAAVIASNENFPASPVKITFEKK